MALMNPESEARRRAEVVDEVSKWTVGLGIIIVALFPLSLPFLILTAVAVLPLLVPLLAIGLVAAVLVVPIRLVRGLARRGRRRRPKVSTRTGAEEIPSPAVHTHY